MDCLRQIDDWTYLNLFRSFSRSCLNYIWRHIPRRRRTFHFKRSSSITLYSYSIIGFLVIMTEIILTIKIAGNSDSKTQSTFSAGIVGQHRCSILTVPYSSIKLGRGFMIRSYAFVRLKLHFLYQVRFISHKNYGKGMR